MASRQFQTIHPDCACVWLCDSPAGPRSHHNQQNPSGDTAITSSIFKIHPHHQVTSQSLLPPPPLSPARRAPPVVRHHTRNHACPCVWAVLGPSVERFHELVKAVR